MTEGNGALGATIVARPRAINHYVVAEQLLLVADERGTSTALGRRVSFPLQVSETLYTLRPTAETGVVLLAAKAAENSSLQPRRFDSSQILTHENAEQLFSKTEPAEHGCPMSGVSMRD